MLKDVIRSRLCGLVLITELLIVIFIGNYFNGHCWIIRQFNAVKKVL